MRATEFLTGLIVSALAAAMLLWVVPAQIPAGYAGQLSPRLLPQVALGGVLALGLWIAGAALVGRRVPAHRPGAFSRGEVTALVALPALVLAALWLLPLLGPLAAGAALVIGAGLMMGERRPLVLAALAAGSLLAGWVLLYRILGTTVG